MTRLLRLDVPHASLSRFPNSFLDKLKAIVLNLRRQGRLGQTEVLFLHAMLQACRDRADGTLALHRIGVSGARLLATRGGRWG